MKITVFTSCYNQCPYLSEAIESVLSQTYGDFEYLLMDDGSTDNTMDVIKKYSLLDKRIIPIFLKKYDNIASVINLSVSLMHGENWVWMPSDDVADKYLLEKKMSLINDNAIVLGWGDIVKEELKVTGSIRFNWGSNTEFIERIWRECFIGMTGVMISKKVLNKVGLFPTHLTFSEDYYWILKSTMFNDIDYLYVPDIVYKKRIHSNRLTSKFHDKIIKNVPNIKKEIKELYGK